jgi:hypothetical protein
MRDKLNPLNDIELNYAPGVDPNKRVKTGGKTSVEAAVEYLETMDEMKSVFDMDGLERAALRRAMGFDFDITFAPSKIFVSARDHKKLRVHVKLTDGDVDANGDIIPGKVESRLADACVRLKAKFDERQLA